MPPVLISLNGIDEPTQTVVGPAIGAGSVFTVITVVILHPVGKVYIIVSVPEVIPVTIPEPDPIIAIAGLLLIQVPPPGSIRVVVEPTHTDKLPVIREGNGLTVIVSIVLHPVKRE